MKPENGKHHDIGDLEVGRLNWTELNWRLSSNSNSVTFGQLSDANLLICREKITSIIGILLQLGKMANEKDLEDNKVFYFLIHSVVSDSLWPHGLYSPWNSPGQNTGVVAFSFFRGSSQPRDRTQVCQIACRFFTNWSTREAQKWWSR